MGLFVVLRKEPDAARDAAAAAQAAVDAARDAARVKQAEIFLKYFGE